MDGLGRSTFIPFPTPNLGPVGAHLNMSKPENMGTAQKVQVVKELVFCIGSCGIWGRRIGWRRRGFWSRSCRKMKVSRCAAENRQHILRTSLPLFYSLPSNPNRQKIRRFRKLWEQFQIH